MDFDFYPHTCRVFRGQNTDPVTGKSSPIEIYSGVCYVPQGSASLRSDRIQGDDVVMLPPDASSMKFFPGDSVEVTFENGSIFRGIVEQAYPVLDSDFGGQDLLIYQRDAVKQ